MLRHGLAATLSLVLAAPLVAQTSTGAGGLPLPSALPLLEQLSVDTPDNRSVWRELGRIYAIKDMVNKSEEAYARAEAVGD